MNENPDVIEIVSPPQQAGRGDEVNVVMMTMVMMIMVMMTMMMMMFMVMMMIVMAMLMRMTTSYPDN